MSLRETAAEIDEAAAFWAARIDRGLTPQETDELDRWIADDRRRDGALARAEATWLHAERARALGMAPLPFAPPVQVAGPTIPSIEVQRGQRRLWTRRAALVGGGALAASVAGAIHLFGTPPPSEQWFETSPGQIGKLTLADGARLVLDTATRVSATIGGDASHVRLIEGRVSFDLAGQDGRRFTLATRQAVLRASGGAFSVAAVAKTALEVMVERGQLLVSGSDGSALTLDRTTALSLPVGAKITAGRVRHLSADALREALRWRVGLLSFTDITVAEAVALVNRYGGVPIVVTDAALAAAPIAGVFRNNDPAGFAGAIADSLDARMFRRDGAIVIAK